MTTPDAAADPVGQRAPSPGPIDQRALSLDEPADERPADVAQETAAVAHGDGPADRPPEPGVRARLGELAMVVGLGALGVFVLLDTGTIRVPGSTNTIGPRFFPYVVGAVLVATAVALAVQVLRGRAAPPEDSEDVDAGAGTDWRTVALVVAGFAAHALLIEPIGWPLAVAVLFAVVSLALGAGRPVLTVGIGLTLGVVVWLVFVLGLGLSLPGGPLEWVVYG